MVFIPALPLPFAAVHHVQGRPVFARGVLGLDAHFIGLQRGARRIPAEPPRGLR